MCAGGGAELGWCMMRRQEVRSNGRSQRAWGRAGKEFVCPLHNHAHVLLQLVIAACQFRVPVVVQVVRSTEEEAKTDGEPLAIEIRCFAGGLDLKRQGGCASQAEMYIELCLV